MFKKLCIVKIFVLFEINIYIGDKKSALNISNVNAEKEYTNFFEYTGNNYSFLINSGKWFLYYVHPTGGVDILFLLFPASGVPLGFQTF